MSDDRNLLELDHVSWLLSGADCSDADRGRSPSMM